jgi:autophagy-related protein 13
MSKVPPSPIGMGSRLSPPQPPFAPSSLSDRRSLASAEGASGSGGGGDESPSPKMQRLGLAQAQGPGKNGIRAVFRIGITDGSGSGVGGTGSEGSVGSGGEKKDGERVAAGVSIRYYYSHGPVFYIRLIMPI